MSLSVDASSNLKGIGVKIVLEEPDSLLIEKLLKFKFNARNNHAKYEPVIIGMALVH